LTIGNVDAFTNNATGGRGYIALAAVIFAGWRPLLAAAACLLFGIADAAQVWAGVVGIHISSQLLATAPYVVTILALTALRRRRGAPGALGMPYVPEQL
jgi:simple sugar transport system permease protein